MTIFRCSCGFAELAQDRAPFACSACPRCRSGLTEGGIGTAPALRHRIEGGRCVHCRRPVAVLIAVGVPRERMEAADA